MRIFLSTLLTLISMNSSAEYLDNVLVIKLDSLKNSRGNIMYRLCDDRECHDNEHSNAFKEGVVPARSGSMEIVLENLPSGTYSLSLFHDRNKNQKLDTNLLGIPKEPFGFSQLTKLPFKKPSFASTKFKLNKSRQTLTVKMLSLL
jgi:uncharacterized protein (DUF2141 family)